MPSSLASLRCEPGDGVVGPFVGNNLDAIQARLETCLRFAQVPGAADPVHRELRALVPEALREAQIALNLVELAERRANEISVELSKLRRLLELIANVPLDPAVSAIFLQAGSDPQTWDEGLAENAAQLDTSTAVRDGFWFRFSIMFLDKKVFNKLVAMNDDPTRGKVEDLVRVRLLEAEEREVRPLWTDIKAEFASPSAFSRTSQILPPDFLDEPREHSDLASRIAAYVARIRPALVRERILAGGDTWPDIAPHLVMLLAAKQPGPPLSSAEEATLKNLLSIVVVYRQAFGSSLDEIAHALQIPSDHWIFQGHTTQFMVTSGAVEKGNPVDRLLCELSFILTRVKSLPQPQRYSEPKVISQASSILPNATGGLQRMPTRVDFALLTALPEEFEALRSYFSDLRQLEKDGSTSFTFYTGSIVTKRTEGDVYSVVLGMAQHQGPEEAGILASALLRQWSPKYVILVGIAGGLHDATALGDVVIARAISDSTWGRIEDTGRKTRWRQIPTDRDLLDSTYHYRETSWHSVPPERPGTGTPERRWGVVVSGGDLIVSKKLVAEYKRELSDPIAVEMEGGAIALACHGDPSHPGFLLIKAVSDHCDKPGRNKQDKSRWRHYAAHIAAAFCIEFLRSGPVPATVGVAPMPPDDDLYLDEEEILTGLRDGVAAVRIATLDSIMEFLLDEGDLPEAVQTELEKLALSRTLPIRERARVVEILRQRDVAPDLLKKLIDEWIGGVDDTLGNIVQGAVTDHPEALDALCDRLDVPGPIRPTAARDALIAIRFHLLERAREVGGPRAKRCLDVARRFEQVPECSALFIDIRKRVEGDAPV